MSDDCRGTQFRTFCLSETTVTASQQFFLNDFEIIRLGSTTPEYQYNLKDHLGNVRVTFTTKYEAPQYTATLEDGTQTQEQSTFEGYSRVTNDLFDHTDAGTVYDKTQLLNGGVSGQVGLSKSLAVVPGDTIVVEVQARPAPDASNLPLRHE
jgi:uncharacterized protein YpiB (UPF0302 family)